MSMDQHSWRVVGLIMWIVIVGQLVHRVHLLSGPGSGHLALQYHLFLHHLVYCQGITLTFMIFCSCMCRPEVPPVSLVHLSIRNGNYIWSATFVITTGNQRAPFLNHQCLWFGMLVIVTFLVLLFCLRDSGWRNDFGKEKFNKVLYTAPWAAGQMILWYHLLVYFRNQARLGESLVFQLEPYASGFWCLSAFSFNWG